MSRDSATAPCDLDSEGGNGHFSKVDISSIYIACRRSEGNASLRQEDVTNDTRAGRKRLHSQITAMALLVVMVALSLFADWGVTAVPASPRGYYETQPDGSLTPLLFLRGDERFPYHTDKAGFTVIRDDDGWYVYAKRHEETGHWTNSGLPFHEDSDPTTLEVPKHLLPADHIVQKRVSRGMPPTEKEHHARRLQSRTVRNFALNGTVEQPAVLQTLAILIRFSDHKNRTLPSSEDIEVVFNKKDGDPHLCPTGSVFDVFDENSNQKFQMLTRVVGWIDLPETEAYYSGGEYGWEIDRTREAFYYALDRVDADQSINLEDYDIDKDGDLDAVTFVHSGIAAEHGHRDCATGNDVPFRIWSHRSWGSWINTMGTSRLRAYSVTSGIWPTNFTECRLDIGRIGLFAYESGHHIGLPDQFGGHLGHGVGNWDFMAHMWGWDGSQYYPPHLSPWSKMEMGWSREVTLTTSGVYTIKASAHTDEVFVIRHGFPNEDEFLIVENRQPVGFDVDAPGNGGLAIWHIDKRASHTTEGFPSQDGFPENGRHYQNALLQADGNYDLEQGINFGNAADLFTPNLKGSANKIGPDGVDTMKGRRVIHKDFPNTATYQAGEVRSTGITISDISEPGEWMSFKLSGLPDSPPPPSSMPSSHPASASEVVAPEAQNCQKNQFWDGQRCQRKCDVLEGFFYDAEHDTCQFLCEVDKGLVWNKEKSKCEKLCKKKHGMFYDRKSGSCEPNCASFLVFDQTRERCVCPGKHTKLKRRNGDPSNCKCAKGYKRADANGPGECVAEVSGNQQRRRVQHRQRDVVSTDSRSDETQRRMTNYTRRGRENASKNSRRQQERS